MLCPSALRKSVRSCSGSGFDCTSNICKSRQILRPPRLLQLKQGRERQRETKYDTSTRVSQRINRQIQLPSSTKRGHNTTHRVGDNCGTLPSLGRQARTYNKTLPSIAFTIIKVLHSPGVPIVHDSFPATPCYMISIMPKSHQLTHQKSRRRPHSRLFGSRQYPASTPPSALAIA